VKRSEKSPTPKPFALRVKWINVTRDNIDKGDPGCPGHCAIARAMKREIAPHLLVEVYSSEIVIFRRKAAVFRRPLPRKAVKWLQRYDSDDRLTRSTCKPFDFQIVLPEAVLAEVK